MHGHGMDELARLHLGHTPISYDEVTGTGRKPRHVRAGADRAGDAYAAEDADVTLRLWQALKPRLRLERRARRCTRQVERRLMPVLLDMERAGIKVDRRRPAPDVGGFRAADGGDGEGHPPAGRPSVQRRLPQAAGRGAVRRDEARRRQADEDRRLGDRCLGAADAGRQGHELPQRILDWRQLQKLKSTYADALVGADRSGDRAGAHVVRAGDRLDRAAVLDRSEPAEHPDPHRGRQPHPPRLHRRAGKCAGQRRLLADRAAAAGACRRHPGAEARVLRAARISMRAPRARCSACRWRAWTR